VSRPRPKAGQVGQRAEKGCPTTSSRSRSGFEATGTPGQTRLSGAGESPSSSPSPELPSLTAPEGNPCGFLDDVLAGFLTQLRRDGKAAGTVKAYGLQLRAFCRYVRALPKPPLSAADLSAEIVLGYRDRLLTREKRSGRPGLLSSRTVQMAVKALRGFFRHLVRRGLLLLDPTLDLRGPRVPVRLPREIPTSRQMRRLLSSPDTSTTLGKRDRAILELLYGTGLRNAELCALTRGDVDLEKRTVFVRSGKGGKERLVPMGKRAAESLSLYLASYADLAGGRPRRELPLFVVKSGRAIGSHVLRKLMRRHLLGARIDVEATPHSLRHACATHLLKGGADIRQIQSLLGHSSLEATQIYTRVETTDLRRMLDRHHPRSRNEGLQ